MDTSKLTFAVFTLGGDDGHCFAGFHDPAITWNGFACPYFYQHEVERMRVVFTEPDDMDMDEAVELTGMPADSLYLPIGSHSWTWEVADMSFGREFLLDPITTRKEAEDFIMELERQGIMWHFDDAPDTVINGDTRTPLFTDAEAAAAACRAWELREVMGDPFGLAVCLGNTEGAPVFRLEWLQGNAAAVVEGSEVGYGDIARFTEEHPEVVTPDAIKWMSDMALGEQTQLATADGLLFQLTRLT